MQQANSKPSPKKLGLVFMGISIANIQSVNLKTFLIFLENTYFTENHQIKNIITIKY